MAMGHLRRVDKVIGICLVAALLALFGLGLSQRSRPTTASAASPNGSVSAGLRGLPSSTLAPPPASTTTGPPAATATTTTAASTTTSTVVPVAGPVSAVGDSIMLDIQPYLETDVPGVSVDGAVSRQFETGIGVVQAERAAGTLGSVLVVELGTNGSVTPADVDAMMQAASGVKRVVFVNTNVPRPWEASDNAVLAAGVARYPGVAVLADWNAVSSPHPEWFTPDQVHLQPAGAQALAALVAQYV